MRLKFRHKHILLWEVLPVSIHCRGTPWPWCRAGPQIPSCKLCPAGEPGAWESWRRRQRKCKQGGGSGQNSLCHSLQHALAAPAQQGLVSFSVHPLGVLGGSLCWARGGNQGHATGSGGAHSALEPVCSSPSTRQVPYGGLKSPRSRSRDKGSRTLSKRKATIPPEEVATVRDTDPAWPDLPFSKETRKSKYGCEISRLCRGINAFKYCLTSLETRLCPGACSLQPPANLSRSEKPGSPTLSWPLKKGAPQGSASCRAFSAPSGLAGGKSQSGPRSQEGAELLGGSLQAGLSRWSPSAAGVWD